jgi:hypothetical protein
MATTGLARISWFSDALDVDLARSGGTPGNGRLSTGVENEEPG